MKKIGFVGTRAPFRFCATLEECEKLRTHIFNLVYVGLAESAREPIEVHVGDCVGIDEMVIEQVLYLKGIGFSISLVFHRIEPQISLSFDLDKKSAEGVKRVIYEGMEVKNRLAARTVGLVKSCEDLIILTPRGSLGKGCQLALNTAQKNRINHTVHFFGGGETRSNLFGEIEEDSISRKYSQTMI